MHSRSPARASLLRYRALKAWATGGVTRMVRFVSAYVSESAAPKPPRFFSVASHATSFMISSGQSVAGVELLPHMAKEVIVTALSFRPYPCWTWYGCHPVARQASSFSENTRGWTEPKDALRLCATPARLIRANSMKRPRQTLTSSVVMPCSLSTPIWRPTGPLTNASGTRLPSEISPR